ncbi:MAG TPA: hypothetical protein VFX00_10915 [Pedococcus sp.]|jgi:hypothetical protein|nr:hypothetical protein [Pedococcus sp.]
MKKRIITALAGGAVVATLAYASASALAVDGGTIQAGGDSVSCDTTGVNANWGLETDTNQVTSVRISNVDPACQGADMFVSVNGAHAQKVVIGATDPRVTFPAMTPESIQNVKVWIEG